MSSVADKARAAAEEAQKKNEEREKLKAQGVVARSAPHSGKVKAGGATVEMRHRNEAKVKKAKKEEEEEKDEDKPNIPPWVVYFLIFVVVGSAVFQILGAAAGKPLV